MFQKNIFSINMFDLMGLATKIEQSMIKILKGVSIGVKKNNLYILDSSIVITRASMAC